MFVLASMPFAWRRVMDRRVLELPHIQGDLAKINIDPVRRDELLARFGHEASIG